MRKMSRKNWCVEFFLDKPKTSPATAYPLSKRGFSQPGSWCEVPDAAERSSRQAGRRGGNAFEKERRSPWELWVRGFRVCVIWFVYWLVGLWFVFGVFDGGWFKVL